MYRITVGYPLVFLVALRAGNVDIARIESDTQLMTGTYETHAKQINKRTWVTFSNTLRMRFRSSACQTETPEILRHDASL